MSHSIIVDRANRLLDTRIKGFATEADIAAYFDEEQQQVRAMGCGSNEHLLIVDLLEFGTQAQEVIASLEKRVAERSLKAKRVAFVVSSTLSKMQMKRAMKGRDNIAMFSQRSEALAWILSDN